MENVNERISQDVSEANQQKKVWSKPVVTEIATNNGTLGTIGAGADGGAYDLSPTS